MWGESVAFFNCAIFVKFSVSVTQIYKTIKRFFPFFLLCAGDLTSLKLSGPWNLKESVIMSLAVNIFLTDQRANFSTGNAIFN